MKTLIEIVSVILACVFMVIAFAVAFPPLARAQEGAVALLGEPCRLKDRVINLPFRATWTEGGKVYEGCWGRHRQAPGVISTYWEDKTIVPIMVDEVRPVRPGMAT